MGLFSGIGKALGSIAKVALPAAASFFGGGGAASLLSAGLGFLGQERANDANVNMAGMNNATAIDLANTSIRRRVADYQAAGLNPALAYNTGGAAVPTLSTAKVENTADAAQRGLSTASEAAFKRASIENLESQIGTQKTQQLLNVSSAKKADADADVAAASAAEIRARTPTYEHNIALTDKQTQLADFTIDKIAADTSLSSSQKALVEQEIRNAVATGDKIRADTGNVKVDTALKSAQIILTRENAGLVSSQHDISNQMFRFNDMDTMRRLNLSEAQKSYWMKHIAPYLPDFATSANSASSVNNLFK